MLLSNSELEALEKKYFSTILYILKSNLNEIERRLKSGFYIKDDWESKLEKKTEIDVGAERVVRAILFDVIQWKVNSTPIGADMVFEVDSEAIIHIDSKTVAKGDIYGDDKPEVLLALPNQVSYPGEYTIARGDERGRIVPFSPNLPHYYNHEEKGKIPCLTYFIKFVYKSEEEFSLENTSFYCLPNGQLDYYGNLVSGVKTYQMKNGKRKACNSTRFNADKMLEISKKEAEWERVVKEVRL